MLVEWYPYEGATPELGIILSYEYYYDSWYVHWFTTNWAEGSKEKESWIKRTCRLP